MYIKRLGEILVQKAFLIFAILSFEVYCRSDSKSPTQRYRSRFSKTNKEISLLPTALKIFKRSSLQRLKILSILGDSAYIFLAL